MWPFGSQSESESELVSESGKVNKPLRERARKNVRAFVKIFYPNLVVIYLLHSTGNLHLHR